jgi:hypothetical protein
MPSPRQIIMFRESTEVFFFRPTGPFEEHCILRIITGSNSEPNFPLLVGHTSSNEFCTSHFLAVHADALI